MNFVDLRSDILLPDAFLIQKFWNQYQEVADSEFTNLLL